MAEIQGWLRSMTPAQIRKNARCNKSAGNHYVNVREPAGRRSQSFRISGAASNEAAIEAALKLIKTEEIVS